MSAVAYVAVYTKSRSVGGDPDRDYAIGVEHGVVGCGRLFTATTMARLTWFTLVEGHLVYNGPLRSHMEGFNPWADSGSTWQTYKVDHHYDLGEVDAVLAEAGVTREVLPNSQNRFVNESAAIRALIAYAESRVAAAATTATATETVAPCPKRTKYAAKIAKYNGKLESAPTDLRRMIRRKIAKYERLLAALEA